LNAAGAAGGGTVFLPAGQYKIGGTLSVPAGVELRGVNETLNTYTVNSRLELYAGKGNDAGTPGVSLGQNAGVRGAPLKEGTIPRQKRDGQLGRKCPFHKEVSELVDSGYAKIPLMLSC